MHASQTRYNAALKVRGNGLSDAEAWLNIRMQRSENDLVGGDDLSAPSIGRKFLKRSFSDGLEKTNQDDGSLGGLLRL